MGSKAIEITYKGKKEIVEFTDSLTFGEVEDLVGGSVDLTDVTKPSIDLKSYRINLLVKVIRKAPFKTGDMTTIQYLDSKIVQKNIEGGAKVPPFSGLYRGLDGDVSKLRGTEEVRYYFYYFCASQFGWDKATVDSQPIEYLRNLLITHKSINQNAESKNSVPPLPRNVRKNF